jgi:serine/threonine protein kinase
MNRAIMSGKPPYFPDSITAEVRAVVTACLTLNPRERPTVQQVLHMPIMQLAVDRYVKKSKYRNQIRGMELARPHAPLMLQPRAPPAEGTGGSSAGWSSTAGAKASASTSEEALYTINYSCNSSSCSSASTATDTGSREDAYPVQYATERSRATATPAQSYSGVEFKSDVVNPYTRQAMSSGAAAFF